MIFTVSTFFVLESQTLLPVVLLVRSAGLHLSHHKCHTACLFYLDLSLWLIQRLSLASCDLLLTLDTVIETEVTFNNLFLS